MRLDPDVILVGEMRDSETAAMAMQAALTGHLVLSSIHANDAVGVLLRLIDLGVEPFLITSALVGVVSQRMVRKLCPHCRAVVAAPARRSGLPIRRSWERHWSFFNTAPAATSAPTRAIGAHRRV